MIRKLIRSAAEKCANHVMPGDCEPSLMSCAALADCFERILRQSFVPDDEPCPACEGKGGYTDEMDNGARGLVPCSACGGSGYAKNPGEPQESADRTAGRILSVLVPDWHKHHTGWTRERAAITAILTSTRRGGYTEGGSPITTAVETPVEGQDRRAGSNPAVDIKPNMNVAVELNLLVRVKELCRTIYVEWCGRGPYVGTAQEIEREITELLR